jgi:hypothetical protein
MHQSSIPSWLLTAACLSLVASPAAWGQAGAFKTDPLDAGASVPPVIYDSPLSRYRAFAEQEVAPWRESNDNAGRVGGWRVYAKEAREPESSGKPQPPGLKPAPGEVAKPKPDSHGHHSTRQKGAQ